MRKGSFWVGSLLEGGVPFWEWESQCGWEVPFWGCPIWMGGPILGAGGGPILREIPLFGGRSHSGGVSLGWEASFRGWGRGGSPFGWGGPILRKVPFRVGGSHCEDGPILGVGVPFVRGGGGTHLVSPWGAAAAEDAGVQRGPLPGAAGGGSEKGWGSQHCPPPHPPSPPHCAALQQQSGPPPVFPTVTAHPPHPPSPVGGDSALSASPLPPRTPPSTHPHPTAAAWRGRPCPERRGAAQRHVTERGGAAMATRAGTMATARTIARG